MISWSLRGHLRDASFFFLYLKIIKMGNIGFKQWTHRNIFLIDKLEPFMTCDRVNLIQRVRVRHYQKLVWVWSHLNIRYKYKQNNCGNIILKIDGVVHHERKTIIIADHFNCFYYNCIKACKLPGPSHVFSVTWKFFFKLLSR